MRGTKSDLHEWRRPRVPLLVRAAPPRPAPRTQRREPRTSRSSSAGIPTAPGEDCAGNRAVRADGDRGADCGLHLARGRGCGRTAPLRRRALRLGHGAARAADPTAGTVRVGFELYAHRAGREAARHRPVSAGSDGVPTTADRVALLALLEPLRERRDIVLVDARGTGVSGRVGERRDAYGAGAAAGDLDAVRNELVPATSSSTPQVTERASHSRTRLASAIACARSCWTAARARCSSPATAAPRRTGSARPSAPASPSSPVWRRGCAPAPCASTGVSTTTCSRARPCARRALAGRAAGCGDCRADGRRSAAGAPRRPNDGAAGARGGSGAGEQLPRQCAARRQCRRGRRPVHRADLAARTRPRGLQGLPQPATPDPSCLRGRAEPCSRARARGRARRRRADRDPPEGRGPAAVGHLRARARSGRAARAERPERLRGALARAFLEKRGKVSPGCASRPPRPTRSNRLPGHARRCPRRAARRQGARPRPLDACGQAGRNGRRARRADVLADAEAGGAPTRVKGLRGGSATVTPRRPASRSRCAACASSATRRSTASSRTTARPAASTRRSRCAQPTARRARSCSPGTRSRRRATPPPAAAPTGGRCCSCCARPVPSRSSDSASAT